MMRRIEEVVAEAEAQGLLPADAHSRVAQGRHRPWPVVVLTGLGAWLAALPLIAMVGLLLGPALMSGSGPYFVGVLCLAGAVVILRAEGVPLFVEQVAVPALLVGAGTLAFGLFRDLPGRAAAAVLALLALAIAVVIAKAWLRGLLGAAAALLAGAALTSGLAGPGRWFGAPPWVGWQLVLAAWVVAQAALRHGLPGRWAAALEAVGAGWLVADLAALAWLSGPTMLLGAVAPVFGAGAAHSIGSTDWLGYALRITSVLLGLVAAGWVAREWHGARQLALAAVALVVAALGWFMPALGAVLLALALAATSRRWALGAVAALAAVWILGAFYDALEWPLATKAIVMLAAGLVIGALVYTPWRAAKGVRPGAAEPALGPARAAVPWAPWAFLAGALVVLATANFGVWQKERLIARGEPLFLALAPVDPRSLIQGDYMRLAFEMPAGLSERLNRAETSRRPKVVARRDERGIATIVRIAGDGVPPGPDERLIELAPKGGRWIVVTDAWFFREGEAARWQAAKFGEFRVEPDGRALLVGLRGDGLKPL